MTMTPKTIKALLGPLLVSVEKVNSHQYHVAVKHGTKSEAMRIVREAGGRADLITCAEIYNQHFVVWRNK